PGGRHFLMMTSDFSFIDNRVAPLTQDVQGTATSAPTPRYAGTRVQRVGDNRLLTGRGSLVDDISRPGMLHACFVCSGQRRTESQFRCARLQVVTFDMGTPGFRDLPDCISTSFGKCLTSRS